MATTAVVQGRSLKNLNTLQRLKLSRTVILALDGVLVLAIVLGAHVHRAAMRTVGLDAAPSIVAAQHIKAALADMDADEANEMLARPLTADAATNGMAKRAPEADAALLEAAKNVTYEAEKQPIETLQVTGGIYNRLVEQTEDLHDAQPDAPVYVPSAEVVNGYRADAMIMDNALLPAADDLDAANNVELQQTYHQEAIDSALTTVFVVVAWLTVLGALVWLQMYLSRRTRRTVNPLLALATVLLLGLGVYALGGMLSEQHELKIAKEDSFESVHALWQARAIAYQLKGEESRYLLDTARAGDYARTFADDANRLAKLPAGMSYEELVARESTGEKVEKVDGFSGFLADELNNITFKGERQAALETLAAFGAYLDADRDLRGRAHDDAVSRSTSSDHGGPLWAFAQFDKALGETLAINQQEFERSVKAGLADVG